MRNMKLFASVMGVTILIIFGMFYFPFCQFRCYYLPEMGEPPYGFTETIWRMEEFVKLYPAYSWLRKGDKYDSIPVTEQESKKKLLMSIAFNCNNTVEVDCDGKKNVFSVDRTIINCFYHNQFGLAKEDSAFYGLTIKNIESKNQRICVDIYRQRYSGQFEGKRVGFYVQIGDKRYRTGTNSLFDY